MFNLESEYSPVQELIYILNRVHPANVQDTSLTGILQSTGLTDAEIDTLIVGCGRELEPLLHKEVQKKIERIKLMTSIYRRLHVNNKRDNTNG